MVDSFQIFHSSDGQAESWSQRRFVQRGHELDPGDDLAAQPVIVSDEQVYLCLPRNHFTAMSLVPESIHRCRNNPTKFNSGRDIPRWRLAPLSVVR